MVSKKILINTRLQPIVSKSIFYSQTLEKPPLVSQVVDIKYIKKINNTHGQESK